MPFTNQNLASFEAAIKAAAGVLLAPHQVDLHNGATVEVKLAVTSRRANETDVTAGAVVDNQLIATIDADDWDAKAGRMPQKGDVIWWLGVRHAVDRAAPTAPAGNKITYRARLSG